MALFPFDRTIRLPCCQHNLLIEQRNTISIHTVTTSMFTHRLLFRTASAAVRKQQWLGAQSSVMGCKSKRMEFHTTAPTSVKAFPEVETDKKITHTPTTVAEREMIRKTEKNAHSDMDKMRPPKSELVCCQLVGVVTSVAGLRHSYLLFCRI